MNNSSNRFRVDSDSPALAEVFNTFISTVDATLEKTGAPTCLKGTVSPDIGFYLKVTKLNQYFL